MGVKDLWKLLEPAGRPVKLESLEGLILAVDVSIWLNQAVKGMRDRHGEPLPHAHLVVLFNRICKLLHYRIKPVFVFDGATPLLKQQTLVARSHKREVAVQRSLKASDKYLTKYLQAKILEQMTGEEGSVSAPVSSRAIASQPDMFELPPLSEDVLSKVKSPFSELNAPSTSRRQSSHAYYNEVASTDIHSGDFNSLPPEVQHELLLERQEIEKYSYHDPATLPKVADDFSSYQISRLMKRSNISKKLSNVRKVLKSNDTAVIGLGEESKGLEVESNRIWSSEASHYILVKGTDIESQSSQDDDTCEEDEINIHCKMEGPRIGALDDKIGDAGLAFVETKESCDDSMSDNSRTLEPDVIDTALNCWSDKGFDDDGNCNLCDRESVETERLDVQTKSAHTLVEAKQQGSSKNDREDSPITKSQLEDIETHENDHEKSSKGKQECVDKDDTTLAKSHSPGHVSHKEEVLLIPTPIEGQMSSSLHTITTSELEKVEPTIDLILEEHEHIHEVPSSSEEEGHSETEEVSRLLLMDPTTAQKQLGQEAMELERERTQQDRAAASVSNQMYKEVQKLLSLFGLPYLVAPMEAEAQCAALNVADLTHGTITDDNDVFLFGGRRVYRNFFSRNREVEVYSSAELDKMLGLSRDSLIVLAYLLGSDYAEGLEGVGIVSAMELLRDFRGNGLEPLKKFVEWYSTVNAKPGLTAKESGQQKKLHQLVLPDGFPSVTVQQAYLTPEVDDSKEEFEWGKPDLDLIRKYALDKMGWAQDKVDEVLLPVLKRMNTKEPQKKISHYFSSLPSSSGSGLQQQPQRKSIKSQRIRNVVASLTSEDIQEDIDSKPTPSNKEKGNSRGTGKGRGIKRTRSSTKSKQVPKRTKRNIESPPDTMDTLSSPPGVKLSASSSSSSEDEFDSIVKNWDYESKDQLSTSNSSKGEERTIVNKKTRGRKKRKC